MNEIQQYVERYRQAVLDELMAPCAFAFLSKARKKWKIHIWRRSPLLMPA